MQAYQKKMFAFYSPVVPEDLERSRWLKYEVLKGRIVTPLLPTANPPASVREGNVLHNPDIESIEKDYCGMRLVNTFCT